MNAITIQRETLLHPLRLAASLAARNATLPIYGCVLLAERGADGFTLTGADGENQITVALDHPERVDDWQDIAISARKLLGIVDALPPEAQITLGITGPNQLHLRSGRSRFNLNTLPGADYPAIAVTAKASVASVATATLRRLLERVAPAMAVADVRFYLNGALFQFDGDRLRITGTDGHRLSSCGGPLAAAVEGEWQREGIIPRNGVQALQRLLSGTHAEQVTLELHPGHLRATLPGVTLTIRLVEGKYPDVERVIPRETTRQGTVNRAELQAILARLRIVTAKSGGVRMDVEADGGISLGAVSIEQDEGREELEMLEWQGDRIGLGFNLEYLAGALEAAGGETARIAFTHADGAALITPTDETDDARFVVMPMRA